MESKKRILITGSEGFIGRNLKRALEKNGHHVVGVDVDPGPENLNPPINILDENKFRSLVEMVQPHIVVHLAASVGRVLCEDDIKRTIEDNAFMTAVVAKTCGDLGVKLVYTSTSEIYGDFGHEEANEDTTPKLPHNLYGLSKRWGEEVAALYAPKGLCVIRPTMPYGPGTPPGRGRRAIDNMMWQAIHNMPIVTHNGAERSWCWIGDLVDAYVLIIETDQEGAFNVGRDDDYRSMTEIAQRACDLAGKDYSLITMVDPPGNQTAVKRLSTKKLKDLGWSPKVELDEGEKILFEWISQFDQNGKFLT